MQGTCYRQKTRNVQDLAPATPRRPRQKGALWRSAGVRFAAIYAVIFGVSAFFLAVVLWCSTLGLLQDQVRFAIRNDTLTLLEHYQIGGAKALEQAISDRLETPTDPDGIYFLATADNRPVVGNLNQWPAGLTESEIWYKILVRRGNVQSHALLRMDTLPDGMKLLVGRDVSARLQLRNVLKVGMFGAMGLMVILGLLGALLIRSLFQRTIRDISNTSLAISRGDISRRVPFSGSGDEFDELAQTINDMLDRIARLMDGVRQVSNSIAHDLRTPVTRARARLEDAALHATSREEIEGAIDRAIQDLDGIVAVFQALLRISEIEAGARRRAFALFDLASMLVELDELYNAAAEENGISLCTQVNAPMLIFGDRDLLQQAVVNLLDNALKFSPEGSTVTLSAIMLGDSVQISVADQGRGISEEDRVRATERFFRAEAARHTAGSGLGLSLVAAVVQLHQGKLNLEDNAPGLRAVMSLPRERPPH